MTCSGIFLVSNKTKHYLCAPVTFCLLLIKEKRRAWVGGSLGCARQPGATVCGVELEKKEETKKLSSLYMWRFPSEQTSKVLLPHWGIP